MSLYKMELYKILHRPAVWIFGAILAVLLGFYFIVSGDEERSTVGGADPLFHDAAIRQDREITRGFAGILTDEKLQAIVDEYGFPSKVQRDFGGWWDKNFLTQFVTDHFSDGWMRGWEPGEYQAPQHLIPIEETDFYEHVRGETLYFGYYKGWAKYIDFMQFAGIVSMAWIVIVLSPLFSQEHDTQMHPLVFTTEYGSSLDVRAKLLAAYTVTGMVFLAVAGGGLAACWLRYGLDGADVLWAFETGSWYGPLVSATMAQFTAFYLSIQALAHLMVCSYCIFASARAKSSLGALLSLVAILVAPLVMRILGAYVICAMQPLFLVMYRVSIEVTAMLGSPVYFFIIGILSIVGATFAGRKSARTATG